MPVQLTIDLEVRPPIDADALWDYWAARVIAGVEEWQPHRYRRAVALPGGPAVLTLERDGQTLRGAARLSDAGDAPRAESLLRQSVDAGMDPEAVRRDLGEHPWLGPVVRSRPGLRAPRHPGGFEVALRAILAQQVSLRAARTHTARLVAAVGTPLPEPVGSLTHVFPSPQQVLGLQAADGGVLAMPATRRRAVFALAGAVADGLDLDGGLSPTQAEAELLALPGIGRWTTQYVRMRALGDPDAFCGTDLVLRRTAERLGGGPLDPTGAEFAPWRTYAAHHLWREAQLARRG